MSRPETYGKLQSVANPEAYRYWLTRNDEPESDEPEYVGDGYQTDLAHKVWVQEVWKAVEEALHPRDLFVLVARHVTGHTLDELARFMDLSRQRVREIERKALLRARSAMRKLGEAA